MATIKDLHKTEEIFENCWYDAVREIGEAASYAVDLKKIDYNEFIEKINTNRTISSRILFFRSIVELFIYLQMHSDKKF